MGTRKNRRAMNVNRILTTRMSGSERAKRSVQLPKLPLLYLYRQRHIKDARGASPPHLMRRGKLAKESSTLLLASSKLLRCASMSGLFEAPRTRREVTSPGQSQRVFRLLYAYQRGESNFGSHESFKGPL